MRATTSNFARSFGPARSSGFTLVELLVVIVLIGIVTAVILPEMRGTQADAQLRAASRKILNVCALASSRAVTLNQEQVVRIGGGEYVLDAARKSSNKDRKSKEPERGNISPKISILVQEIGPGKEAQPEQESQNIRAKNSLRFFPDGTAEAKEIELKDRDGFRIRLRINPTTARFRVSEISRE